MTPQPGCRFAIAPHFHLSADWSRRLLIGAGGEEAGHPLISPPSWRPPTPDELSLLVQPTGEPTLSEVLEACVYLFQLPGHLRSGWWALLDQAAEVIAERRLPGLEAFVNQVVDFLAFKSLSVPEGASCDVVVSNPGERVIPWAPSGPRLWGAINLGDEETSIVLIPQPGRSIRLILGPGEGCRLPRGGLIVGGYPGSKQEPDVLLLIAA